MSLCVLLMYECRRAVFAASIVSFNHGSKTCWMKARNSSNPSHNGDTSGLVTNRGGHSINASCSALPAHERVACPDDVSSDGIEPAKCVALGCCFDPSESSGGSHRDAVPRCYYYSAAKGARPPCSLNGVQKLPATTGGQQDEAGGCVCDAGWHGKNCELLRLKPANLSDGYNSWSTESPGTSSWGGECSTIAA